MQSDNKNTEISEEEIDKVINEATEDAKKEVEIKKDVPDSEKINPNKDLIPQRVKLNGLGYVDLIGTKEKDATFEAIKTMVFKVINAAFAITEINPEEGTFTAKLMNYSPLVREKETPPPEEESNSSES